MVILKKSKRSRNATSSRPGSRVKTFPLPENVRDWPERAQDSFGKLSESLKRFCPAGFSLKMFPDYSLPTTAATSESFKARWENSGMAWRGASLTANTSEYPNVVDECSLSDVLEPSVPEKYYLSPRACQGILKRAERRGRTLPTQLERTLRAVATRETGE